MENHYFTCVTSRHSGGSYLNAVELMNGCLAVVHSNLFIPSTIGGAVNTATDFDETQLKQNLDLASDVYIARVQGAPCGEAKISLFKGACDEAAKTLIDRRNLLTVYLSGRIITQSFMTTLRVSQKSFKTINMTCPLNIS